MKKREQGNKRPENKNDEYSFKRVNCVQYPYVAGNHDIYETSYFDRRDTSSNIVLYIPQSEKVMPLPCVHLEFRLAGVDNIINNGLVTLSDLYHFNAKEWLIRKSFLYKVKNKSHSVLGQTYRHLTSGKKISKRAGLNIFKKEIIEDRFLAQWLWYYTVSKEDEGKEYGLRNFLSESHIDFNAIRFKVY